MLGSEISDEGRKAPKPGHRFWVCTRLAAGEV